MGTVSGKRCVKQIVYDLEKHWLFWKDTGGAVTLEELERQALYEPNIRGQAIFGDPLRTKPVRVLVNISAEGLSLWETGKRISHRWADRTPPDFNGLAALLKGLARMSDLGIEELPPGRYAGMVEKVRYTFDGDNKIIITYRLDTPNGIRRVEDDNSDQRPAIIGFPLRTTQGLARVEDILRIKGLTLADAEVRGLKALPGLLEGTALGGRHAQPSHGRVRTAPSWFAWRSRDAGRKKPYE